MSADDSRHVETVADRVNTTALNLYRAVMVTERNLFFSPYTILIALSMAYVGARGRTAVQMRRTMLFPDNEVQFAEFLSFLLTHIQAVLPNRDIDLKVANGVWLQIAYPFQHEFLSTITQHFGASAQQADFQHHLEETCDTINRWVAEQTDQRIRTLLSADSLDTLTRLLLINAIYFSGNWSTPFQSSRTETAPFWVAPETSVTIPMMAQKHRFRYGEADGLQVLQLPYVGDSLSMTILLPKQVDGVSAMDKVLSVDAVNGWISGLRERDVTVFLPKFSLSTHLDLVETLSVMGMPDAFSTDADFSGISAKADLYILSAIHQADLDVHETGSEAAAATAVVQATRSLRRLPPVIFRADHPFIFLLSDHRTGTILFIGRVINPLDNGASR